MAKINVIPLKDLIARQDRKWREIKAMEQKGLHEGWSHEKLYAERLKIVYKHRHKKPDVRPLIYKTMIGHYGGLYVDVPEEHFKKFKAHFPSREFPRRIRRTDVREKYTFEGEKRFRKRFPKSNILVEVFFGDRSKGLKRLDFMEMPRPE